MRSMTCLVLVLALGCGGGSAMPDGAADAPNAADAVPDAHQITAADYEGLWLMTSLTMPQQDGTYVTVLRAGDPSSIRGDALFHATDSLNGTLDVRQVLLDQGLIASPISALRATVAIEPGVWVLTDDGGGVSVFAAALAGDHLVLTLVDDPRNTAESSPAEIVLDRRSPWTTTVVGTWDMVSMELPSQTVQAGSCVEIQTGSVWAVLQMEIVFDDRLLFTRTQTIRFYTDDACSMFDQEQTSVQTGLAEEENDDSLRIWATENAVSVYQAFSMAVVGDTVTLTRTDCLPQPDCTDTAPVSVVVTRR